MPALKGASTFSQRPTSFRKFLQRNDFLPKTAFACLNPRLAINVKPLVEEGTQ